MDAKNGYGVSAISKSTLAIRVLGVVCAGEKADELEDKQSAESGQESKSWVLMTEFHTGNRDYSIG